MQPTSRHRLDGRHIDVNSDVWDMTDIPANVFAEKGLLNTTRTQMRLEAIQHECKSTRRASDRALVGHDCPLTCGSGCVRTSPLILYACDDTVCEWCTKKVSTDNESTVTCGNGTSSTARS